MSSNNNIGEEPSGAKISFREKIKKFFKAFGNWLSGIGSKLWQGAAIGALAALIINALILGAIAKTGLGTVADILIAAAVMSILIFLSYHLIRLLLKVIKSLPEKFMAVLVISFLIMSVGLKSSFGGPLLIFMIVTGSIIGFAILRGAAKPFSVAILIIIAAAYAFVIGEFINEGYDTALTVPRNYYSGKVTALNAADPSLPGEYKVKTLFYGTGTDKRRPEYDSLVTIKTNPVDATPFLSETTGLGNSVREWYWGFNAKNFPLNARVWYPDGNGHFPLVLIVHGNHQMEEYSDPGYEYLGRLMASRGFIFASVDENFLNGNWIKDFGQSENFTRGWLLLQHLKLFRAWDSAKGNPFYEKIDMNNIALIGHSRGGQAVAIAAAINKLKRYYVDAKINFDFNFAIKGIIQIAPIDVYQPSNGRPLELNNIDYLILQGGYDGDMFYFMGDRQYNRLKFSGDDYHFKSAVYIYRANHGQFNTVWGRSDFGAPNSWLLNLKPLMKGEDQRRAAEIYISAFLEASLRGRKEYLPLLKDYRKILNLLPEDFYISQFEDSREKTLADYEEDFDVLSATMPGCSISGENLKVWSENCLVFRDNGGTLQDNKGVYLGWDTGDSAYAGKIPRYSLSLSDSLSEALKIDKNGELIFFVCNNKDDAGDSTDISIELADKNNNRSRMPISKFGRITPPLKIQNVKWDFFKDFGRGKPYEKVLQLFRLPLSDFTGGNSKFDPSKLKEINFIFDRSVKGEIILDKIGIEPKES